MLIDLNVLRIGGVFQWFRCLLTVVPRKRVFGLPSVPRRAILAILMIHKPLAKDRRDVSKN